MNEHDTEAETLKVSRQVLNCDLSAKQKMILPDFIALVRIFIKSDYFTFNNDRCLLMRGENPLVSVS